MYLAMKRTGLTLAEIGKALGGLEYKPTGKAVQRFEASLATRPERRKLARSVLDQLSLVDPAEKVQGDTVARPGVRIRRD